jgi:hypothetical protein
MIKVRLACGRKPVDVAVWCPDKDAVDKIGDRAYQVLVCHQHASECMKSVEFIDNFVEEFAKPFWIESRMGLDRDEFVVFSSMLKKLTSGEYWIFIFDTKRFMEINHNLRKCYNQTTSAHEDYSVTPTKTIRLNALPPHDTIFVITAKKSVMSTEQLEAIINKEDLQFSQKYIDNIVSKFKDVQLGSIPCQQHQLAIEMVSAYNIEGEMYPLPICSFHNKKGSKWLIDKYGWPPARTA